MNPGEESDAPELPGGRAQQGSRIRRLRNVLGAAVVLALVVAAAYLLRTDTPPPAATPAPASATPRIPPPPPATRPTRITTLPVASTAAKLNSPDTTVEDDLATLNLLLSQYRKTLGGNPVGANDEITAAMLGRNAKGLAFLPPEGPFLDETGRLVDRWGTPYFFHVLSARHMDITSAGPDRKLHTDDDLVHEQ